METFRNRLKLPLAEIIRGGQNNWQTYAMKGEWLRVKQGLASREGAVKFIEESWQNNHKARIAPPPFLLYHDRSSNPDTLSVEAVGRGNLLGLIANGYDGPSAAEIAQDVETATRGTLLTQDPSGQVPTNGRTDDHVWVDIGYQLEYEVMAERSWARGDKESAGVFRRAANLAFQSASRRRRTEGEWAGSFSVTKNFFDPALRVAIKMQVNIATTTVRSCSILPKLSRCTRARSTKGPLLQKSEATHSNSTTNMTACSRTRAECRYRRICVDKWVRVRETTGRR